MSANDNRHNYPWPGLFAYKESDSQYFFGRESEIQDVLERIKREVPTVLYGPSGVGKTSLLCAGIFPQLKREHFLPVYIRLDHSDDAPPYATQVAQEIEHRIKEHNIDIEELMPSLEQDSPESLWEVLHRHAYWDKQNFPVRPVLVFDQFEELFTLANDRDKIASFIKELEHLAENTMPASLKNRLKEHGERLQYKSDRYDYRIVISLREDFLARLQELSENIPILGRNRVSIQAMNGEQALLAVSRPGREILDDKVAEKIVYAVANLHLERIQKTELARLQVDPSILSLFCSKLNDRRLAANESTITVGHVESSGRDILESYYKECIAKVSSPTQYFIEDHLLTSCGFRNPVAADDVEAAGVPAHDVDKLVKERLLHYEERQGVRWLEISHDKLTPIMSEYREQRLLREQQEQELIKNRHRTRRLIFVAGAIVSLLIVLLGVFLVWYDSNQREIVEYYNTMDKKYGLPYGIGKLSKAQVRKRFVSYKFIRTGRANPVTRVEAVNGFDHLTRQHQTTTYLRKDESGNAVRKECIWEFILDADKKYPVYEMAKDMAGNLVWGFVYSPNRDSSKVRASYIGPDGFPKAQQQSKAEYIEIEYDENGFEKYLRYMDRLGNPMPGPDGAFGQMREHDQNGLLILIASIDGDGNFMIDNVGNCGMRHFYNEKGFLTSASSFDTTLSRRTPVTQGFDSLHISYDNFFNITKTEYFLSNKRCMESSGVSILQSEYTYSDSGIIFTATYYDTLNEPVYSKEKIAGFEGIFDSYSNLVKATNLDSDGNPCYSSEKIAGWESDFDTLGNLVEIKYFGADYNPCYDKDAVAGWKSIFERGNEIQSISLDVNGIPCFSSSGIAGWKSEFDERGNEIMRTYIDINGNPCLHTEKNAGWKNYYDERGNQIKRTFFNEYQNPCLIIYKYAGWNSEYDAYGNEIKMTYIDEHDEPCYSDERIAGWQSTYDERGNEIARTYIGIDGKPCLHKDNNAGWRSQYDIRGNLIERSFVDIDGKLCLIDDEYAGWIAEYNAHDNEVKKSFFNEHRKPCARKDGVSTIINEYDDRGNNIKETYYDINGKPCSNAEGYAGAESIVDARGNQIKFTYLGVDNKPCLNKSQEIASANFEYDERDRIIKVSFFGTDSLPCLSTENIAGWRSTFDEHGNEIERVFLDTDGHPCVGINNIAGWSSEFDESGSEIKRMFLNTNGEPGMSSDNYAGWMKTFDERGNVRQEIFLGLDGKPTAIFLGYFTGLEYVYDKKDTAVRGYFLEKDGQRTERAHIKYVNDKFGNLIETQYVNAQGEIVGREPAPEE